MYQQDDDARLPNGGPRGGRRVSIGGEEITEAEADQLANRPMLIATVEMAEELRDWLEAGVVSITAQLEVERMVGEEPDVAWLRRAAHARAAKEAKLARVEKRLAQLQKPDRAVIAASWRATAPDPIERARLNAEALRAAANTESEKTERARLNVEAARFAAERRAHQAQTQEQAFVRAAERLLPREQYERLWLEARNLAGQSQPPELAAPVFGRGRETVPDDGRFDHIVGEDEAC